MRPRFSALHEMRELVSDLRCRCRERATLERPSRESLERRHENWRAGYTKSE